MSKNKIGADAIADVVFRAVGRGELHVLTHNETKVAWFAKRMLPWRAFQRVVDHGSKRVLKPRPPRTTSAQA